MLMPKCHTTPSSWTVRQLFQTWQKIYWFSSPSQFSFTVFYTSKIKVRIYSFLKNKNKTTRFKPLILKWATAPPMNLTDYKRISSQPANCAPGIIKTVIMNQAQWNYCFRDYCVFNQWNIFKCWLWVSKGEIKALSDFSFVLNDASYWALEPKKTKDYQDL